jgi:thioredoxin-dependent peroxiredoxin
MSQFSEAIPTMSLKVSGGKDLNLPDDFKNRWTLLYFYPKDDTPGCTVQACSYRDNIQGFSDLGVSIYGVSLDDLASHEAFREKYHLNFPLIFDESKALSTFVGCYGEQEWKGEKYMGLSRDTVLINPEAKMEKVWRGVDPKSTVQETLTVVTELVRLHRI